MAAGKIQPALKDWALALHTSDPQAFAAYVAAVPAVVTPGGGGAAQGLRQGAVAGVADEEAAVMKALGLSPDEFAKAKKETV